MASYLSNSEVALFRSCQIQIVLTLLLREVLVICDNGQICESFIASGVGGAHYHNCHLKPSPLPNQWNPYQPPSSYLDLAVFWRPVVFLIYIYQQSYFQRKRHHCHLKPSPRYALQSTLLMAVATRGCACVRNDTCGGRICGHQNSLGPARSSGLCQSLKPETDGGGGAGLWCTVAQFIWCIVVHAWCNTPRAAAAYNTGRLDNFPEVEQHQRRHNFEAQLIIFTTKRRIPPLH